MLFQFFFTRKQVIWMLLLFSVPSSGQVHRHSGPFSKRLSRQKISDCVSPEEHSSPLVFEKGNSLKQPSSRLMNGGLLDLVNTDSISKTIIDLQNFGTRYDYSQGRVEAGDYLFDRFQDYGLDVIFDPFEYHAEIIKWLATVPGTSHVWAVGDSGYIIHSPDCGDSWERQTFINHDHLRGVFFLDTLTGWCYSQQGHFYHTGDGGQTWSFVCQFMDENMYSDYGFFFTDSLTGWITNYDSTLNCETIVYTRDGGKIWQVPVDINRGMVIVDIEFVSPDTGFAVDMNGHVLNTTDGGETWVTGASFPHFLIDLCFLDSGQGYLAGGMQNPDEGYLYRTEDGGESWEEILHYESDVLYRFQFHDENHGWITGFYGLILYTQNGGDTWQQYEVDDNLLDMVSPDSDYCVAISYGSIYQASRLTEEMEDVTPSLLPMVHSANVVAVKPGSTHPDTSIVNGAHYDSISDDKYVSAPGADDNASGVAGVMELARLMSPHEFPYTLKFIAFSGEELGLLGSFHYVANLSGPAKNIKAMVNFDMIAHVNSPKWPVWIRSDSSCMVMGDLAYEMSELYTDLLPTLNFEVTPNSDHYPFQEAGYPVLYFAEKGTNPNYHTTGDAFSTLDIAYEADVLKMALATVYQLNDLSVHVDDVSVSDVAEYRLYGNYPNPFNPQTTIEYSVARQGDVRVAVYDLLGRQVRTLVDRTQKSGHYRIVWDGKTQWGQSVTSGVYLIRLESKDKVLSKKVVLIK